MTSSYAQVSQVNTLTSSLVRILEELGWERLFQQENTEFSVSMNHIQSGCNSYTQTPNSFWTPT